jgi:glutamyl-Q tRNA(Asp) synthetase
MSNYVGRFAPSPTGPLHAGSLVAALASWLDARAHGGQWLVRMEDVDEPRCSQPAAQEILRQLLALHLHSDAPVMVQSQRKAAYAQALAQLQNQAQAYACACSRKDIEAAWAAKGVERVRHGELIYPGTCRAGLQGKAARAWRFKLPDLPLNFRQKQPLTGVNTAQTAIKIVANQNATQWQDRRLGAQEQNLLDDVGDFVLLRADGFFAYQLAVVVDDAAQGVTHIVRGEDLADNTPRQIALQRALGYAQPQYLHAPLVLAANGEKLSKQNGAPALDVSTPAAAAIALAGAATVLGLHVQVGTAEQVLAQAVRQWRSQWVEG